VSPFVEKKEEERRERKKGKEMASRKGKGHAILRTAVVRVSIYSPPRATEWAERLALPFLSLFTTFFLFFVCGVVGGWTDPWFETFRRYGIPTVLNSFGRSPCRFNIRGIHYGDWLGVSEGADGQSKLVAEVGEKGGRRLAVSYSRLLRGSPDHGSSFYSGCI
jgi:hypothetical protein